jgi:capsular exopolysaccharide synthesis family protein
MSRLHGALNRATGGNAPILPPEARPTEAAGQDTGQAAFSVPWSIDTTTVDAEPRPDRHDMGADAKAEGRGISFSPVPVRHADSRPFEIAEKLVWTKLADDVTGLTLATEQYRKLAAGLHQAQSERGVKLVLVTSPNPGEGKSLTTANLALTLSESYQRRVLLIDGDLRRASQHEILGVASDSGLSEGLGRASALRLPVIEITPRLSLLPSGRPMDDPTTALSSARMQEVLETARASYDWTIVDTPPVGMLTDAKLLAAMVDGVVLVIEAGVTAYHDAERAIDAVGRDRVLGVVLNRFTNTSRDAKYYQSYYGRPRRPRA